ncbi:MAG TPA: hypothetical protein VMW16_04910 [Sedimentisphaerales bacterium]|nr:hypothetical protein [Sedimentisphaerales bacterium]
MKKIVVISIMSCLASVGCDSLRFAPGEIQKQNAWLHSRTVALAAEQARREAASEKLQALTGLGELQSRAFIGYCGLPKEFPPADTAEQILSQSSFELAGAALSESAERPDVWQVADNVFELAIGISALLGGVYGTKAVRFLQEARTKSKALKEIIEGNELFKKEHGAYTNAFKEAHKDQSPETRQIVAQLKS